MKLTPGKRKGLEAVSDSRGVIAAAAMDQRGSLKSAIAKNYCSFTALQTDPLLVKLRSTPEFGQLLSAAKECQKKFLEERDRSKK